MSSQRYIWKYPESVPDFIRLELDNFSQPVQSVLYQRGIRSNEQALNFLLPKAPDWSTNINLLQAEKASQLILNALDHKDLIAVYGDYDADGITSTALLTLALREIGGEVLAYIPDRQREGYGLNPAAIKFLADQGVSLLITVDNGIRSLKEVAFANSLNLNVIITDHHTPGNSFPDAAAILNPKLPDDPYPNKNLAGVGVAYKLICSLSRFAPGLNADDFLDLVAIGTIADIVPLTGENRYLVRQGLNRLNNNPRQSIKSLLGASGLLGKRLSAADISFQIAPRLNSSGRLDSETSQTPLDLLLSQDLSSCAKYAQILENHNTKRKLLSKMLEKRVEEIILEQEPLPPVLFVIEPDVSIGLAGIAAGYLSRKYNVPAIVGQLGSEATTASCRSIPEFDIIQSLDACQDLFSHYGGHPLAAGFTIPNKNISHLKEYLFDQALSQLPKSSPLPALELDAEVVLTDLDSALLKELEKLEPTGDSNPLPVLYTRSLRALKQKMVGKNSNHLKLVVTDGRLSMDAIGFGLGNNNTELPSKFDLAFHLTVNHYQGSQTLQLQILDLIPS
jgi:single-stranded-DNA-specific exonuclease